MPRPAVTAVAFDLGGVLIDWNPRHLYRRLFDGDDAAMEAFLRDVCSPEWNVGLDAGRAWDEAIEELVREHPDQRDLIEAYRLRWSEMLGGPIHGTVEILAELDRAGIGIHALSNWSAETFTITRPAFPFLESFGEIVISGDVGMVKPDPRIFRLLLGRIGQPAETVAFVDDSETNVRAAAALGLRAIRFRDPDQLRADLAELGLPGGSSGP